MKRNQINWHNFNLRTFYLALNNRTSTMHGIFFLDVQWNAYIASNIMIIIYLPMNCIFWIESRTFGFPHGIFPISFNKMANLSIFMPKIEREREEKKAHSQWTHQNKEHRLHWLLFVGHWWLAWKFNIEFSNILQQTWYFPLILFVSFKFISNKSKK